MGHKEECQPQFEAQRQEDDVRGRVSAASDAYRKAVTETQGIRQEYFNFQLPRILRVRMTSLLNFVCKHSDIYIARLSNSR